MDLGISGKTALVTGASAGIGECVAKTLALEGAKVAISARGAEKLAETANRIAAETGGVVEPFPCDIAASGAADQLLRDVSERLGPVSILVNNAGRAHAGGLLDSSDTDWEGMFNLKVMGMIRCCRAAVPQMQKLGWGRIVNMSSVGGTYPNNKLMVSHSLSAAICNATKSIALDVAGSGILANAIGIGAVATKNWEENMIPKVRETRPDMRDLPDQELMDKLGAEMTPVGRFGNPQEIAELAAFLGSARNGFVTGATVEASGGADRFM